MRDRSSTARAVLAALCLAGTLPGCLVFQGRTDNDRAGRYVSDQTLSAIQPGSDPETVTQLLGEPSSRATLPDGSEVWRWSYSTDRRIYSSFLFLFSATKNVKGEGSAYVEFKDGKVTRTWRD